MKFRNLVILLIIFFIFKPLSARAYPDAEYDDVIQSTLGNTEIIKGASFQEHSFFSNKSNCWYYFWYDSVLDSGSLLYSVYDLNYTLVEENQIATGAIFEDFDVDIDKTGERVYVVYREGNFLSRSQPLYCVYLTVDNDGGLTYQDLETITTYSSRDARMLSITVTGGGIIIHHGEYIGTGNMAGRIIVSNSTTGFVETYSQSIEGYWLALTSVNIGNNFYHVSKSEPLGNNGIVIAFEYYNPAPVYEFQPLAIIAFSNFDYDVYNITTAIDVGVDTAPNDSPSNLYMPYVFDLAGSSDGENFSIAWIASNGLGATPYLYCYVFNYSSGGDGKLFNLQSFDVDNVTSVNIYTNLRESFNVVYYAHQNETVQYVFKWRRNNNTFSKRYELWNPTKPSEFGEGGNYGFRSVGSNTFTLDTSGGGTPAIQMVDRNSDGFQWAWFYLDSFVMDFEGVPVLITPPHITNDYYEWLFMSEPYTLTLTANYTNYAKIEFSDTVHDIIFEYNESMGDYFSAYSTDGERNVIGIYDSNVIKNNITKEITWRFILGEQIVDSYNTTWTYTLQGLNGSITGLLVETPSIYNLGGLVSYRKTGIGGRVTGGESLEIYAENNGVMRASVIFRRLQGVHLLYEFNTNGTWNAGTGRWDNIQGVATPKFGIQVLYNGSWWNPLEIEVDCGLNKIGHSNLGNDISELTLSINYDVEGVVQRLGDTVTTYHYAYYPSGSDTSKILTYNAWMDIWFNQLNSSTVIGGRISPYYYAMEEKGFWLWASFSPNMANVSSSTFFADLTLNGTIVSSQEIELVRFYVEIDSHSIYYVNFEPYQILDYKLAEDRMQGIPTPVFVDTKVIDMPNQGFVNPIIRAIQSIGKFVRNGIFQSMRLIIAGIDSFLVLFGLPQGIFSTLVNTIVIQVTTMFSWLSIIAEYVSDSLYVFVSMMNWIVTFMGYIINAITWFVVWVIPIPIHLVRFMYALITSGTWTYMNFTWDFSSGSDIMQAGIQILPYTLTFMFVTWLFFGEGDDNDTSDIWGTPRRVIHVFKSLRESYQSIFWFFTHAQNSIISMYNFIRSHIPFLSSGGGEEDEG
jgi:hypothetical protein